MRNEYHNNYLLLLTEERKTIQPRLDELYLKIKLTVSRIDKIILLDEIKVLLSKIKLLEDENKALKDEREEVLKWKQERKKWQEDDQEFAKRQREIWKGCI